MPFEANFHIDDFRIIRADEIDGDEPYLFIVYWALDDGIRINSDGSGLTGSPTLVFRGGRHGNLVNGSINEHSGDIDIPAAIGTARLLVSDVTWLNQVRAIPGFENTPASSVPSLPFVGCTVVAVEEDNTPGPWIVDIFNEIESAVPALARRFIASLQLSDLLSAQAINSLINRFQNRLNTEAAAIAEQVGRRKLRRTLRIFQAADKDNFVGVNTMRLQAGQTSASKSMTMDLELPAPAPNSGGLSGGSFGPSGPSRPHYRVQAKVRIERVSADRRIAVDIDFDGRDDERGRDEVTNPPPSSFMLTPGTPVLRTFRWGDELRCEYDFRARTFESQGRVEVTVDGRLFEGASESTNDLDGTGRLVLDVRHGTSRSDSFTIRNTDEDTPNDFGRLRVTVRNEP